MCGRFTVKAPPEEIEAAFELFREPEWEPRYNIAPSQPVGAVRLVNGQRAWTLFRWGLIPSWAKDEKIGYRMINARGETIHEKTSFCAAFKRRRCLIVADGFYEWQRSGSSGKSGTKSKQPFHIRRTDQQMFAFAGLWECWTPPDGSELESCTIVTAEANELLAPIHDRMPVILSPDEYDLWLDPEIDAEALRQLLDPHPAADFEIYPVSTDVNNARTERPGLDLRLKEPGESRPRQTLLSFDDE